MPLYGVIGAKGVGKTLFSTSIAYTAEVPVISNITSFKNFPKRSKLITYTESMMFDEQFLKNKMVILDEFYLYADNQSYMSKSNQMYSSFSQLCRKFQIDVFFISQTLRLFDTRVKEMFDYLIEITKKKDGTMIIAICRISDMSWEFKEITPETQTFFYDKYDTFEIPQNNRINEYVFRCMNITQRKAYAEKLANDICSTVELNKGKSYTQQIIVGYMIDNDLFYDTEFIKHILYYLQTK